MEQSVKGSDNSDQYRKKEVAILALEAVFANLVDEAATS